MIRPLLALAILVPAAAFAQTKFEMADVHASAPSSKQPDGGFMPGGRVELRGFSVLALISMAYDVEPSNVLEGPAWLDVDRFDIIAKAPAGVTSEEKLQGMLKILLQERFGLKTRADKKELPVFVLTARKGLKLPPAAKDGPPSTARGEGDPALNNHVKLLSYSMAALAEVLPQIAANFVNHPVVDETHIKGSFDFQLDWMGIGIYRKAKANPDGPPAVGVLDALEKIGLHLEAAKRPQEVMVIERVNETPTPNAEGVTAKIPQFPTEFDVAEVRPAKPLDLPKGTVLNAFGQARMENGRVEIMSGTLQGMLAMALQVEPRMIVGPKWMEEDRFDVIAKTAAAAPFSSLCDMLKKVLMERFEIATHTEDQPMPVFVLEAGKKPKLKESDGAARSDCHVENTDRRYFICKNTTMAQLAERLPNFAGAYVHRPLLDLTGLPGAYDFQAFWTPKAALSNATTRASAEVASTPVEELTVFEALDKQLGIKLEEQKHPVPVVMIDKVERTPREK